MTYSINTGSSTEAFGWNNIDTVLNQLPDNTSNLISPHDLRDAVYTVWQGIGIKPTSNSANIEYLGIDQTNLYDKIFLGKKQVSSVDILSSNLLSTDIDMFFYNLKNDTNLTSQNTKIGFLAGASVSVFYNGTVSIPYIETKSVASVGGNVLDFNIKNDSFIISGLTSYGGNISLYSKYGNVLINGIVFPKYTDNLPGVVSDGSILTFKNIGGYSYVQWLPNTPFMSSITASGTFSIVADNITLNGYNTSFTDLRPITATFGSITVGSTFSNVPLVEVIRMMLYSYVEPRIIIKPYEYNVEITSSGVANLTYSITKVSATGSINNISSYPTFITDPAPAITYLSATGINLIYSSTSSYTSGSFYSTTGLKTFTMSVTDNTGITVTASTNINVVYPIFYGTSTTASTLQSNVQNLLSSFTKVVDSEINRTIPISGDGVCIYYCVPNSSNTGATVASVYDTSYPGTNLRSNFRSGQAFTMSLSSPDSYWGSTLYNCYVYSPGGTASTASFGLYPSYSTNYEFNF